MKEQTHGYQYNQHPFNSSCLSQNIKWPCLPNNLWRLWHYQSSRQSSSHHTDSNGASSFCDQNIISRNLFTGRNVSHSSLWTTELDELVPKLEVSRARLGMWNGPCTDLLELNLSAFNNWITYFTPLDFSFSLSLSLRTDWYCLFVF